MGRDTIQLKNAVSTISQEYLLEFTSEYGIPKSLHPELPGPTDPIVEFPEGKVGDYTKFFEFANFCIPISKFLFDVLGHYQIHLSQLSVMGAAKLDQCSQSRQGENRDSPLRRSTTANRVIDMEDMTGASGSSGTPSTGISSVGNPPYTKVAPEPDQEKETAMGALVNKRCRKRGPDEAKANVPPKVLRKDHVTSYLSQSTLRGKSLATMGIGTGSTVFAPATQETPVHTKGVSDPDPLSSSRKAVVTEDPDSKKSASFTFMVGSPGRYFSELRHLRNEEFLNQYNTTLTRQVAMGSQLREKHIKNLEALLEDEADIKDIAEAKNVELVKEFESLCVQFSDLQVSNHQLSQQVSTLQAQVTGEERIKAAFEEFKKYEDDRVSSRCAKIDARLDALSIDFDEELYPHMLTVIASRRWVIEHGLRIAIMKCVEPTELRQVFVDVVSAGIAKGMSEGLKHGVDHEKDNVDLVAIEAYNPEADTKYVAALHALKDLKYPLVDQLEKLKDAPIDVIMSSLYVDSDSGEDAPQWIRELRPSSS
uniref:Transposase (Putative), gypsy type n=1 Tax=Tanacetum cinerariifolium TaxID=118510 RepID=A0A699I4G4_TANCI|nr:transposase (putative), gypsy type [Tanacetum cinerariifolium]